MPKPDLNPQPEPAVLAAAWAAHDAAAARVAANAPSWPARLLWLNALRRLRAVDPGFRHRPR